MNIEEWNATNHLDIFKSTLIDVFEPRDWSAARKSRKSCRGNIDTFFGHRTSMQPLNVRVGHAMEAALKVLGEISPNVTTNSLAGSKITGVKTSSSISGSKQIDNAVEKNGHLFIIENKSSADMDNKGWAEVLKGAGKVSQRSADILNRSPMSVTSIILCQNDVTDQAPKHKYANSLIASMIVEHEFDNNKVPEVKGWDWYFNLIELDINEIEYYNTISLVGKMITCDLKWGDWSS